MILRKSEVGFRFVDELLMSDAPGDPGVEGRIYICCGAKLYHSAAGIHHGFLVGRLISRFLGSFESRLRDS